jgi:soluble lytic murein transglycosylase
VSTVAAHTRARTRRPRRAVRRRRLLGATVAIVLVGGIAVLALTLGPLKHAFREITLPLRHEDIIRQQSRQKGVDAALIAAVIYEESKFRDQTSHAGARGLMQITPATAAYIARRSGGVRFQQGDLATPQINISYGAYYLRYLIDRYGGNRELAIAAYNAGETNVDRWVRRAGDPDAFDTVKDIPFPETREYVRGVESKQKEYRDHHGDELGY